MKTLLACFALSLCLSSCATQWTYGTNAAGQDYAYNKKKNVYVVSDSDGTTKIDLSANQDVAAISQP